VKDKLENYEPVKIRKKRFYQDYSDGRILVDHIVIDMNQAVIKATTYKNKEDQERNLPLSMGYAQEIKGQGGFANKHAWCENCEESAIGRALDNAGYATNDSCSREEMIKVKREEEAEQEKRKEEQGKIKDAQDGMKSFVQFMNAYVKPVGASKEDEALKKAIIHELKPDRNNADPGYWKEMTAKLHSYVDEWHKHG